MTSPVIQLARECGAIGDFAVCFTPKELVRFHAKAQAQALRDAAREMHKQMNLNAALALAVMAEELEKKT